MTGELELGDNTFLNLATPCKVAVDNYHLMIKDNGKDIPVWDIMKFYDEYDSRNISGKNITVKATLTDKDNAFDVSLLEYPALLFQFLDRTYCLIITLIRYLRRVGVLSTICL